MATNWIQRRVELRQMCKYPPMFAKLEPVNAHNEKRSSALVVDVSRQGIGLISPLSFPIGTRVAITISDCYAATGEVVDVQKEFDGWNWSDMKRMNVHLIEKQSWPV